MVFGYLYMYPTDHPCGWGVWSKPEQTVCVSHGTLGCQETPSPKAGQQMGQWGRPSMPNIGGMPTQPLNWHPGNLGFGIP